MCARIADRPSGSDVPAVWPHDLERTVDPPDDTCRSGTPALFLYRLGIAEAVRAVDRRPSAPGVVLTGRSLSTRPFLSVLALALLGFGMEALLRPVVTLTIIARGGDAVLVGLIAGAYALPSLLFRPLIGRLVDRWRHGFLLRLGGLVMAAAPLGMLLPSILPILTARFVQGTGWSFFSVSNHALMAKSAPATRRGEASGYFNAMPALALLVGPAAGVALFTIDGRLPFIVAAIVGVATVAVAMATAVPAPIPDQVVPAEPRGRMHRILEPSAIPAMLMTTTFMAAQALFIVFAPVYALAVGAPVEALTIYYPVYGAVLTIGYVLAGRVSDVLGRTLTVRVGCVLAIIGLAIAALPMGLVTLLIGGAGYAVATSLVAPTMSALTMDRALPGRIGAAMATFSIGYHIATGLSSIVWGALIAAIGFPWPFAVAIGLQVITLAIASQYLAARPRQGGGTHDHHASQS